MTRNILSDDISFGWNYITVKICSMTIEVGHIKGRRGAVTALAFVAWLRNPSRTRQVVPTLVLPTAQGSNNHVLA